MPFDMESVPIDTRSAATDMRSVSTDMTSVSVDTGVDIELMSIDMEEGMETISIDVGEHVHRHGDGYWDHVDRHGESMGIVSTRHGVGAGIMSNGHEKACLPTCIPTGKSVSMDMRNGSRTHVDRHEKNMTTVSIGPYGLSHILGSVFHKKCKKTEFNENHKNEYESLNPKEFHWNS